MVCQINITPWHTIGERLVPHTQVTFDKIYFMKLSFVGASGQGASHDYVSAKVTPNRTKQATWLRPEPITTAKLGELF